MTIRPRPVLAAALTLLATAAPAAAQLSLGPARPAPRAPDDPTPPPLGYVFSGEGLAEPGMEGGRTELEFADVDADGRVDLVSIGDHGSPFIQSQQHGIMVWFGNGAGAWSLSQTGNFGYGGVALGDVDGDGHMDVGYGMHHDYSGVDLGDQLMEVALGDGTGTNWTPWDDDLGMDGQSWGMFGTDFGDVDGDGDLDIGSNSFGCCDGIHVYLNDGDGSWTHVFGVAGGNSATDFQFADVDGDGHLDVVASNSAGAVWRGDGTGAFVAADGNLALNTARMHVGDVDGDGADELLAVSGGAVRVYRWGPGDVWTEAGTGLPGAGAPFQHGQLADMDGDGRLDVLAVGNGEALVAAGDGTGTFAPAWGGPLPGPGTPDVETVRAADFDHNGRPDFALVQDETTGLFQSKNHLYAFREASVPTAVSVRVARPGTGRTWRAGQVRFVEWVSAVPGGLVGTVDVELSLDGPGGPWTPLVTGVPDNGRAQVVVPGGAGADARVRVTLSVGGDVRSATSGSFTVL